MIILKTIKKLTVVIIFLLICPYIMADDKIKVGILHSLSGNMAFNESVLKDLLLMMIKEVNDSGGVLGKKIEPIILDTKSDWPTFSDKSREMITKHNVSAIFGCWTSISRKHVKPVVEEHGGILFYPLQYEGQEKSKNVVYTGGVPNQHAIPVLEYFLNKNEEKYERFYFVGEEYLFPRVTIDIMKAYLLNKGINKKDIKESFTNFENKDWYNIVKDIKNFSSENKKTLIVTIINGNANKEFYHQIENHKLSLEDVPVIAILLSEAEISQITSKKLAGTYLVSNYFMNLNNEYNNKFIDKWRMFSGEKQNYVTDAMDSTFLSFSIWLEAVKKANSSKPEDILKFIPGIKIKSLSGYEVKIDDENNHLHKPFFIAKIEEKGKIKIIFESGHLVKPENWNYDFNQKYKDNNM